MNIAIVIFTMMVAIVSLANAQSVRVLLPDLAFQLECGSKDRKFFENKFETFLNAQRFQLLNMGTIRRTLGVSTETTILGLDNARRIIDFHYVKEWGIYSVILNTQPPTRRALDLERKLLAFVQDNLRCKVQNLARHENRIDASDLHDREVTRVSELIRQAEVCPKESGTMYPDRQLCRGWPRPSQKPNPGVQQTPGRS